MKQAIYEPTLFLCSGKEMVKFYTMERPVPEDFYGYKDDKYYETAIDKFLASAVEYTVCEGNRFILKMEVSEKILNDKPYIIEIQLESGIRIDELSDRLEVFEVCENGAFCPQKRHENVKCLLNHVKQIRLRPEVKEEDQKLYTETDMINSARYGYDYHKMSQFPDNDFDDEAINNFKQYLTTVKPNNP